MTELSVHMLDAAQVEAEWAAIEPMLEAACKSNEISEIDMTPADIKAAVVSGLCVLFLFRKGGQPAMVLVIQFTMTNGHKGAEIMAMGGNHLMAFKAAYWPLILDWLRANGCEYLDAFANERLAALYLKRFGFTKSCTFVRAVL